VSWEEHTHRELDELRNDVYGLRSDSDALRRLSSDLQYELRAADESLTERLDEASRELRDELDENSRAITLLASRIEWLEGLARRSGAAELVNLDEADAESNRLAALAERGRHARSRHMSDSSRTYLQSVVSSHAEARRWRHEHRQEVLSLSADLASTPFTAEAHKQAADKYDAAVRRLETATANVDRSAKAAKEAQAKLNEDDTNRAKDAPTIRAGDEAQDRLNARIARRLSDALDRDAMMPLWFIRAFGPTRPADATQEWIDTAIAVQAFRLTCGITDPAVALGPPLSKEHPQHQRDWYQDLDRRLSRLRE
jgi:hypothetical protein